MYKLRKKVARNIFLYENKLFLFKTNIDTIMLILDLLKIFQHILKKGDKRQQNLEIKIKYLNEIQIL